jgi:RNA polymerase sigma-70 factor (ECF subfamily)
MRTISRRDSLELQHEGALSYLRQAILARPTDQTRLPPPSALRASHATPSPADEAVGRVEIERYDRALRRLVPVERNAIIARVELGYSYDEVASAIGCSTADEARRVVITGLLHLAEEMRRGA